MGCFMAFKLSERGGNHFSGDLVALVTPSHRYRDATIDVTPAVCIYPSAYEYANGRSTHAHRHSHARSHSHAAYSTCFSFNSVRPLPG